jgi:hypothetical protein
MIFRIVGNICLALAVLFYATVLWMINAGASEHDGAQGGAWGLIFLLLPLWFCLAMALCASNANGGLDWLSLGKGSRYLLVVVACLAMAVTTILSGALRHATADQIPWAMRPLVPGAWALWTFPVAVAVFCVLTVNPRLGPSPPQLALRLPVGVAGGLSLLVVCGLLLQWFVSSQQMQAARVDAIVSEEAERARRQLDEVRALDARTNLRELLPYTNRYKDSQVRQLALEKIRAVPDLEEQLAVGLRSRWCEGVLMFLDASDPPDSKPLAEPARDAFLILAEQARQLVREPGTLYPDTFDYDVRLIVAAAEKFRPFGVDYAPAIRVYRTALDEPRRPIIKFNATATLDAWLARRARGR